MDERMNGHVLDLMRSRRSIPRMQPTPVPRELIERLLDAAVWVPNHRLTEPWQFFVLDGAARRRFAEIRRDWRRRQVPDPEAPGVQAALDKVYRDTADTPMIIIVTSHVTEDPELREEDAWATFGAAYGFMLGAWAHGLGTYFRTGTLRDDPALREMLRLPEDRRVIGVLYVGYPAEIPQRRRTPAAQKTVWLDGAPSAAREER
jgi:nitroreductase